VRLKVLAAVALALGVALCLQLIVAKKSRRDVLAFTACPVFGAPRTTINPGVETADLIPVRMHERIHESQCRELGALRYALRNMTRGGELSLETPAYCAGANARVSQGMNVASVRARLLDDMDAQFDGMRDAVRERLQAECPELFATSRR
jgi:hypothetical protein